MELCTPPHCWLVSHNYANSVSCDAGHRTTAGWCLTIMRIRFFVMPGISSPPVGVSQLCEFGFLRGRASAHRRLVSHNYANSVFCDAGHQPTAGWCLTIMRIRFLAMPGISPPPVGVPQLREFGFLWCRASAHRRLVSHSYTNSVSCDAGHLRATARPCAPPPGAPHSCDIGFIQLVANFAATWRGQLEKLLTDCFRLPTFTDQHPCSPVKRIAQSRICIVHHAVLGLAQRLRLTHTLRP